MKTFDPMAEAVKWSEFRNHRNRGLAEEHGWLTLVDLTWISAEPATIPRFPGRWWVEDEYLRAEFADGDGVISAYSEDSASGFHEWILEENDSVMDLVHGSRLAEVAKRGGCYCVRVRDAHAPLRLCFDGVPVWAYDPRFVCAATIELIEPELFDRQTYRDDVPGEALVVGKLTLKARDGRAGDKPFGRDVELLLEGDPSDSFVLNFHDETNGKQSAPWRFVSIPSPFDSDAKVGQVADVDVDFNYALNFPSAFTTFGTCPKPISGNAIPWSIEAGEQQP